MTHEINLLQDTKAPAASGLSLTVVALAPLVTGALFLAAATFLGLKERSIQQHVAQLESSARARAGTNVAQDGGLAALEHTLAVHSTTLDILRASGAGDRSGFAENFRALARSAIDGVWLTGVSLDHETITVHGRALSPDRVSAYLAGLQNEPLFTGHAFSTIELKAPKEASNASAGAAPATGIEFTLASQAVVVANGAGPARGTGQ
jgi:Tfp pilus assembly protein PilN